MLKINTRYKEKYIKKYFRVDSVLLSPFSAYFMISNPIIERLAYNPGMKKQKNKKITN